jgi:hypothetical protein
MELYWVLHLFLRIIFAGTFFSWNKKRRRISLKIFNLKPNTNQIPHSFLLYKPPTLQHLYSQSKAKNCKAKKNQIIIFISINFLAKQWQV